MPKPYCSGQKMWKSFLPQGKKLHATIHFTMNAPCYIIFPSWLGWGLTLMMNLFLWSFPKL
jgi:hypothetical protein